MSFDPNDFTVLTPSIVSKVMHPYHALLNKEQKDTRGKKACPGSREVERRALIGKDWKRVLDGENLRRALRRETWSEFGVERKDRR
ncbi:hypothetical protein TNCV_4716841 [Trichonephila clavipes]|nr:hypothetical protein TNCV_4716841 [Trichonephila clavipes]